MAKGIITEESAAKETHADFCRCPFCACCFLSIQDLERHMATFGRIKWYILRISAELMAK
jgi:hypothetical protein